MARIDDYKAAFEIAAGELNKLEPAKVAENSGVEFDGQAFHFDFLGKEIKVSLEPVAVTSKDESEISITDQVLILHYLTNADGRKVTGEWIAYREVPGADYYAPVFYKRAIGPLVKGFGEQAELLTQLAASYNSQPGNTGDVSVIVKALPNVPFMLIIWKGDDEFPAEANILMDKSIGNYLSAEDIAWLAGSTVYPLIGRAMAMANGDNK